ncbi:Sodium/hydrogen exchanger family-domain-containing protein [Pseudomassariella vexata]|uniref:Sodium/hydrogen exchanger family-domain-containing protein n=1 Tax=Pseudomassariella vexata TaxID=1141098 RepID=A0A1Y2DXS4_9PEZI|nr:Sodium/hydrogen exchanger family-domain-containing protein [Pseudomassariella vexata]ORY64071.1 Sodium/hydrogen exchanger family-domain-containing protein [Pseudomassariella vexata]
MPTIAVTNFNVIVAVLGGWISLFGLVSYLLKENFYLSEALISLLAGVTFSPHAANLVRPLDYAMGNQNNVDKITLYFSRLVLGVQLVLAGVQLPSRYLKNEWKPLSLLLGPVMACMWVITSLLIWGLTPGLPFLHALAIGACVTPTDPVLSNVIVKGKFADHNVPKELQKIIIAESGANDGLGYPFLFFALYLIKYIGDGGQAESGGAGMAMGLWFGETWGYIIILSVIYGAVVGWLARELLHFAESRKWVDRESFLVFALSLALFITGTCGMVGSDDVLACFIAGNVFTWDDCSLQPTIDMLLNVTIFMWYGAVCPWTKFVQNDIIPIYRLIPLGILILLFRRPPVIFGFRKLIHQIDDLRQAIFMGFFGPVGVSGIFYLYITLEFLDTLKKGDTQRGDVAHMGEATEIIVWFIAVCSVVVHGLSIPLGKFGFYLPRTISRSLTSPDDPNHGSFRIHGPATAALPQTWPRPASRGNNEPETPTKPRTPSVHLICRVGGSTITADDKQANQQSPKTGPRTGGASNSPATPTMPCRTIRFPDEENLQESGISEAQPKDNTERSNDVPPQTT